MLRTSLVIARGVSIQICLRISFFPYWHVECTRGGRPHLRGEGGNQDGEVGELHGGEFLVNFILFGDAHLPPDLFSHMSATVS